ncbi:hypothetical protein [Rodentibacter haemolyticus]|uniref:Uncharacterized protein n=1 Tax=Rodentibacter haemolyticus TaxID=2778911 RepID=A0ABX6V119_9PAST|nr:hypothetical protein [Rodentibacter haemolyticus]QPB43021.1 hypothetical protein IHV77_02575 [Rodentibacter haemolyticus]
MKRKNLFYGVLFVSMCILGGCAELKSMAGDVATSAKDSAVMRAKAEASVRASEATGKILGSKY